jgi:peptide/nickel transport system substrate-binding protein
MKKRRLLFVLLALLALVVPAAAQENPGPGEGAPIIQGNFGGDIATLNPIISNDGSSNDVIAELYPVLLGIDYDTLNYAPGAKNGMVIDYQVSEDGTTHTFTLRDDWMWSDGTPITSADYKYAFDAIASGATSSPLGYVLDTVQSVEAPDPQTLVITTAGPDCTVLNYASAIPFVPSHVFSDLFGEDYASMNESDYNLNPTTTAGRFAFQNFRPGEQVTLVADQNYPDSEVGYVVPEGMIYKTVADQTVLVEQFLAGELTFVPSVPEDRQEELRALADAGQYNWYEAPAISIQFMSFNMADPENPQNGLDEAGEAIDQGNHPILGDVRVRQAILMSLDWNALNEGALNSTGIQLASHALPTSWAFNEEVEPYPFDLEGAAALLDEAGFVDDDSDPSTPRVATEDALYAEPGTPLAFSLMTNAGNTSNEAMGVLMQDQLRQSGFEVDFQAIDFNTLVGELVGQTYDAILLFWGFAFPDDPDSTRVNFDPSNDVIGSGFNVSSYNNPEVTELLQQARTMPGCDQEARAELYSQVQQILRDDAPWMWVATSIVPSIARGDIGNWNPIPGVGFLYNREAWAIPR